MNLDPRFLRSQARLHDAILKLAAAQPPGTITVTQLAKEARVHRSTVYEHAESPEQLLRQAITSELSKLPAEASTADHPGHSPRDTVLTILTYLEHNEQLYRRMADSSGVVISEALASHLAGILLEQCGAGIAEKPINTTGLDDETFLEITTRAITDALVRVLSKWLELPDSRDPELAEKLIEVVLPEWCSY